MENHKKEVNREISGYGTGEITIQKLVFYNLLFFVPIIFFLAVSRFLANWMAPVFETTILVTMKILMLFFMLLLFFIIIPFIRKRESISGVRYALIGFLIVAMGLTIPSIIIQKRFDLLITELPHIASYILLTFIYTPEVLGMDIDISNWFKHYKQLFIILIYFSILMCYIAGFGGMFYDIAKADPSAFAYSINNPVEYSRYFYFSVISFATIGYGDITPVSSAARFLVCVEAFIGLIVNVIFIAILFVYVSNFQAFLKGLKEEGKLIRKEEREIEKLEKEVGGVKKNIQRNKTKKTAGKR